jgi:hypothetical protein
MGEMVARCDERARADAGKDSGDPDQLLRGAPFEERAARCACGSLELAGVRRHGSLLSAVGEGPANRAYASIYL